MCPLPDDQRVLDCQWRAAEHGELPISDLEAMAVRAVKDVSTPVGAPEIGDPRLRLKPRSRNGRIVVPLTQHPGGHAWKVVIPPEPGEPTLRTHHGYEWLYVLSGQLHLILAEHDLTMGPGEAAEFDTRLPHWFGPTGDGPVEILSVHSSGGEPMRLRVAPRNTKAES